MALRLHGICLGRKRGRHWRQGGWLSRGTEGWGGEGGFSESQIAIVAYVHTLCQHMWADIFCCLLHTSQNIEARRELET